MSKPTGPRKTAPWAHPAEPYLDECLEALDQLDDLADPDVEEIMGAARRVNDGESFD